MSGKVSGLNKSELIREYLREYPGTRTKDVVEHFKGQGVSMSQQLVAGVRAREIGAVRSKPDMGEIRLSEVKAVRDFVQRSDLDSSVAVGILTEFSNLVESFGSLGRFRRVLAEYVRFEDGEIEASVDPEPEHEDHEEDVGTGSSYIDVNDEDSD
jgi:hypothetical protein